MKRHLRLAGLVSAVAIVAAACSPAASTAPSAPASAAPSTAASTAPSAPAAAALAGELTLWHAYSSGAGTELDALNEVLATVAGSVNGTANAGAENPDLKITTVEVPFADLFNKYNTDAGTGGGPDLFIAPNDSLGFQAREGVIMDLDTLLAGKLDGKTPTAVSGSKVEGKLYMVPESLKAVGLFYDSAKVATPPATTADLLAGVKDGSIKAGFFGGNDGVYHEFGWWAAFGGALMDSSGKCIAATTGVPDAYKYLVELQTAGAKFFPKYDDMANGFKDGSLNLIVDGPWATGGYKTSVPGVKSAPMPAGPSGPAQPLAGVDGWYINPASKDTDLAVAFALRMTDQSAEQVFVDKAGHIPANSANTITDPITQGFADAVATGFPRPQIKQLDNFWGNFGNAQQLILETGADPVKAITDACAAMDTANDL